MYVPVVLTCHFSAQDRKRRSSEIWTLWVIEVNMPFHIWSRMSYWLSAAKKNSLKENSAYFSDCRFLPYAGNRTPCGHTIVERIWNQLHSCQLHTLPAMFHGLVEWRLWWALPLMMRSQEECAHVSLPHYSPMESCSVCLLSDGDDWQRAVFFVWYRNILMFKGVHRRLAAFQAYLYQVSARVF